MWTYGGLSVLYSIVVLNVSDWNGFKWNNKNTLVTVAGINHCTTDKVFLFYAELKLKGENLSNIAELLRLALSCGINHRTRAAQQQQSLKSHGAEQYSVRWTELYIIMLKMVLWYVPGLNRLMPQQTIDLKRDTTGRNSGSMPSIHNTWAVELARPSGIQWLLIPEPALSGHQYITEQSQCVKKKVF